MKSLPREHLSPHSQVSNKLDRSRKRGCYRWMVLMALLVFPAIMLGAPQDPAAYSTDQNQEKQKTPPGDQSQNGTQPAAGEQVQPGEQAPGSAADPDRPATAVSRCPLG